GAGRGRARGQGDPRGRDQADGPPAHVEEEACRQGGSRISRCGRRRDGGEAVHVEGRGRVRVHAGTDESIDVLLQEGRTFPRPDGFRERALIRDESIYAEAERDLDAFWLARTAELVGWSDAPQEGLRWDPPHCTWFADGRLNASHSCLDRH